MASSLTFFSYSVSSQILPSFCLLSDSEIRARVRFRTSASESSIPKLSRNALEGNGNVFNKEKVGIRTGEEGGNGELGFNDVEKDIGIGSSCERLQVLWEDGYGTSSVKDYLDRAGDVIKPDGGPPRWFCPIECGRPMKDSPVLLFLPGIDGVGLGLILHTKALGKVFEVRCLHIPVSDRTPLEGLIKIIENTLILEHGLSPNKPIYLVGDSLGGCLALAIAARNPNIDLILILSNPATSFGKSQLQLFLHILEAIPYDLHVTVPYLLSVIMGDPLKMATVNIQIGLPHARALEKLSGNLTTLLQLLSGLTDIIPKGTLIWKLKLLRSASAYANSRLHAVKAEVLVLASGKDNFLPSGDEAKRLWTSLQNCRVRYFKDNGHTLLLEDSVNLLSVIKGTNLYRHFRRHDYGSDYIPPSMSEYNKFIEQGNELLRVAASAVMLSTLENGEIVRGLSGVPNKGPVLLVGYHMLMGLEVPLLIEEFLREKRVMVRGMAHPMFFSKKIECLSQEFAMVDILRLFGAVPVSGRNMYKLLSTNSFVLLYPGGARKALHRKGEEYMCFWPDQPEFVRLAALCDATIVPFGVVGEDDIAQYVLDYDDQMKIPIFNDFLKELNKDASLRVRTEADGEVANQNLFMPGFLPKIPGRFYYLFGKPIETKGRSNILKDREMANALYFQIKSEVENLLSYLLKKREEDPYRGIVERTIYKAVSATGNEVPTFDP